ncbi:uncharacterized protein LOC128393584 [Panonychus citri]|uniref:uncharacterized protein LOC128393584 n=1 Tax=Panonychus citri TaxID=50023 RepID=UPI002306E5F6|nr:uncharacterized protein LOC128393584 [Panonychus citri]
MKGFILTVSLLIMINCCSIDCQASRETDFLSQLTTQYDPSLIVPLFKDSINQRIKSIVEIRQEGNINLDQSAFCNITLQSLALLHDLIGKSFNPSTQDLRVKPDVSVIKELRYLIKQYETIINLFNYELQFSRYPQLSVETPESLIKLLKTKNSDWIKMKTLQSIDKYINDLQSIINSSSTEVNNYQTTLAQLSLKQLISLKDELKSITTYNYVNNNQPLSNFLDKFQIVIKIFADSQFM